MKGSHCLLAIALALAVAEAGAGAGIQVYVDKDYKGASIEIDQAVPDLRELDFDDRISSLRADERWLVCSAPRYKGDCREVEGGLVSLRQEGLNDRITSLRPAKNTKKKDGAKEKKEKAEKGDAAIHPAASPATSPEWWGGTGSAAAFGEVVRAGRGGRARIQVFEERDFGGRGRRFDRPVAELKAGVVRSVLVENGPWEICTRPAFEGDCRILRDSAVDLDDWSQRIESLRPVEE